MHDRERATIIVNLLRQQPVVHVGQVVEATGASPASVRRDFTKLVEAGQARRVHGGVELPGNDGQPGAPLATRAFDVSRTLNGEAKRAIARAAVELCADGEAIIINGGTTTYAMADFLRPRRLKILTNSYPLAERLIQESQNRVALPGGEVYREQKLIVSPFDDDAIQHYSASLMFMSAISIGPLGVIEGDPLIARAETKLLRRAERLVVLADSSKFARRGSLVVCPLARIDTLITDEGAPAEALDMLRAAGVKIMRVALEASARPAA